MDSGKLTVGDCGDEVTRLHETLQTKGINVSVEEVKRKFFGPATREAVCECQKQHGLEATGEVDKLTAAVLSPSGSDSNAVLSDRQTPLSSPSISTRTGFIPPVSAVRTPIHSIPPSPQPVARPSPQKSIVYGEVKQQSNDVPIIGAIVQAFHQTADRLLDLGKAVTNDSGFYQIPYTRLANQSSINLMVRVFNSQGQVLATSSVVNNASVEQRIDIVVTPQEQLENPFIVEGHVHLVDARNTPLVGAIVEAVDLDLRGEQTLGNTKTDQEGFYQIRYSSQQFRRAEKRSADLIVKAFHSNPLLAGPPILIASSPTIFNAQQFETVNLVVDPKTTGVPSELERILRELVPLLENIRPEGIPEPELIDKLADLKPKELDFLTRETNIDRQKIAFLVAAAILQKWSHTQDANIPAAIFYGLAREGLPLDLLTLYRQGTQKQRTALEQVIDDNIIPALYRESLDRELEILQQLLVRYALQSKPTGDRSSLSDLLSQSALPPEKQARLLNLYVNHDGSLKDFWQQLSENSDFREPGLVKNIQFTLQLGVLVQNNVPLIRALKEIHKPTSTRDLVGLTTDTWTSLVNQAGVPADIAGETYVSSIVSTLQVAFPTEAVAQVIARAPDINLNEPTRTVVSRFYQNVSPSAEDPDPEKVFDIRTSRVDDYIAKNAATVFNGIPDTERASVVTELKRQQRVFRLSTSLETMTTLLGSGFNSAHAIADMPRATFMEQMKDHLGGEQQAQMVYQKAQQIDTTNLLLYTQIREAYFGPTPRVMAPTVPLNSALNGFLPDTMANSTGTVNLSLNSVLQKHSPTLTELFGSLDLCDCQHCRSILSPAAYFVDLLHLLENSKPYKKIDANDPNQEGKVPLELLLQRRPDLEYLKLTCENTNTPIPYIDLVNEILESYVALLGQLDQTTAKDTGDSTAAELSANPQYVENTAYKRLQEQAVYPLTLPYNRFIEAVRVYLEHLGSSRDQVMQAFQKDPTPPPTVPIPMQAAIDTEYLRLSPEEYEVLTGLKFDGSNSTLSLTSEALYGADAFVPSQLPTVKQPQPNKPTPPASVVLTLQRALNATGANPALQPNGEFGTETNAVVKAFQASHGLTATGEVDLNTWTALQQAMPKLWQLFLTSVPVFLSHTDRTVYTDLIELLKTRFINRNFPQGDALTVFERIPFSFTTLTSLVHSNFAALNSDPKLQKALQDANLTAQELIAWSNTYFQTIQKLIVLESPGSTCNLEVTTLQHLDGTPLTDEELIRLNRFIRLWRKLGWTISDLDKALTALGATEITPTFVQQMGQIKRLQTDLKLPLVQLLSLWANIDIYGENSLYKKLFISKAALQLDGAFAPNPNGTVLTNTNEGVSGHIPALLAAFRISETDLTLIRVDAGLGGENTRLNLVNVSVLYRYTVLAKTLKLKIKDLIALKILSGVDPFSGSNRTQHFVDIARKVKRSGFTVAQLNYLYRHQWEPGQAPAPSPESVALLVKALQDGLKKIAQENLPAPDPMGELTHTKLAILFEPAIADQVVQMINGSFVYTTKLDNPPTITFPASIATKITYNAANKVLSYVGAMSETEKTLLFGLASDSAYQRAINELFKNAKDNQTTTAQLEHLPLVAIPSKKATYDWSQRVLQFTGSMTQTEHDLLVNNAPPGFGGYINAINQLFQQPRDFIAKTLADFLKPSDAIIYLLETPSVDADGKPDAVAIAQKFAYVLEHIDRSNPNTSMAVGLLPYLRDKLSRSLVKQTLSDALKLDSAVTQILLEPVFNSAKNIQEGSLLKAFTDASKPAIADFLMLVGDGLSVEYFDHPDFSGNEILKRIDPTIGFNLGQDLSDPSIKYSVRWIGKLLTQYDETYTFHLSANGTLKLWIDGQEILDQETKTLKTGQLYDIEVKYARTDDKRGAIAELQWSSPSTPKATIPQSQLYSGTTFQSFDLPLKSYYLLHKIALLVNTFKITAAELVYLSTHSNDFAGFNLNTLPLAPSGFKVALFEQWLRLNDLFNLRNSLPKGEINLIDVFEFAASGADKSTLRVPVIKELAAIVQQHPESIDWLVTLLPAASAWTPGLADEAQVKSAIKLLLTVAWTGLSEAEIYNQLKTNQALITVANPDPTNPPTNPDPPLSQFVNLLAKLNGLQILTLLLTSATGWNIQELDALIGPQGFTLGLDRFKDERWLIRLQACMQLVTRLGISAKKLFTWTVQIPDSAQVQDIKNTVKAKYDDQTWLTVAKPLSDKLRESQKAALIAYVLTMPNIVAANVRDSNQLFEYFVIDVETTVCMKTSRIKQAISSVQLFVDRCRMNLESGVLPDAIDADVWKWMKYYRVWEANRKVFLYPENWTEPELRDNKTPFFKELESELLQNDLTMDTAETAFLNYLEKLDQVARLEICGMYWETREQDFPTLSLGAQGSDVVELQRKLNALGVMPQPLSITGVFDATTQAAVIAFQQSYKLSANGVVGPETWGAIDSGKVVSVLHVFGRTFHIPHLYYYRRLINNTTWTAWEEKVQADIEGDQLIPVVWNGRLHIFWPIFTEKAVQPQSASTNTPPRKYWEIKLAWSEYKNNKWSAKQLSSEYLQTESITELPTRNNFYFKAFVNESLTVRCYCYEPITGTALIEPNFYLVGNFDFAGCHGTITHQNQNQPLEFVVRPYNSAPDFMTFRADSTFGNLTLIAGDFGENLNLDRNAYEQNKIEIPTLNQTKSTYRLLYPHQYPQFVLQAPFFYQDDRRTYFVTPRETQDLITAVTQPNLVELIPSLTHFVRSLDRNGLLSPSDRVGMFASVNATVAVNTLEQPDISSTRETAPADSLDLSLTATRSLPRASSLSTMSVTKLGTDWATRENEILRNWVTTYELKPVRRTFHLKFATHFHPYVCEFIKALNREGIPGLLTVANQLPKSADPEADVNTVFNLEYQPTNNVDHPYPHMQVDLNTEGETAYSLYNWELFFHVVMRIATSLTQNQRFEEARRWFHYIFDPTASSNEPSPQRYWNLVPFKKTAPEKIEELLEALSYTGSDPQKIEQKIRVQKQILQYMYHPFQAHASARLRLGAYMKNVVMKYIDNIIAHGDQLFSRDTIESINEATLLYVTAANILGDKPQRIPPRGKLGSETYASLKSKLNLFSNAMVSFENDFPFSSSSSIGSVGTDESSGLLGLGKTLYFCTPQNEKLLGYWDTVADRLFKIRHCMNIEGIVRELPLFEPPIDPALLVRAAAAGVDLNSVLNNLYAALPHYRFNVMVQKANELCAEVKSLGAGLLSAWEKRDAEELATIRANQETTILGLVRLIKQQQYDESVEARSGLGKSRDIAVARYLHYQKLLGQENQPIPQIGDSISESSVSVNAKLEDSDGMKLISYEKKHLDLANSAKAYHIAASVLEYAANIAHLTPDLHAEPFGVGSSYGGSSVGKALSGYARSLQAISSKESMEGASASTLGGFFRRQQDWVLQTNLAAKEIMQIDKQIAAGDIRVAIAQQEITNHEKQIQNAKEIEDFLSTKFTNEEIYKWMIDGISGIYFQSYQLAYDVARKAERAYQFELGRSESFIQFGYWDSLRKGLLAGEKLYADIKRLEVAYLDQHRREYEITKQISLVLHDPLALIALKETGQCEVFFPETLFDADYPGHYMRRINNVSLTIPCVTGPYTSINCTLTLLSNKTRISSNAQVDYPEDVENEDPRFVTNFAAMQSIATSTAQNDSGMFELNFRDEHYLPFQVAGAISRWRIDMPQDCNAFDFDSISDVIIKLNYTAREGGEILKEKAKKAMQDAISDADQSQLARLFSAKHEFSTDWYQFLNPTEAATAQTLNLRMSRERFPFQFRGNNLIISKVELFLNLKDGLKSGTDKTYTEIYAAGDPLNVTLKTPGNGDADGSKPLNSSQSFLNGIPYASFDGLEVEVKSGDNARWSLTPNMAPIKDDINDLFIICRYTVS
jgi:peptidoglycan hydrolase-like protein with peptidoglycan-binding domain